MTSLRLSLFAAVAFSKLAAVAAVYPASFPFESEHSVGNGEIGVPSVRPSTPSYTHDNDDVGGYVYTGFIEITLTEDDLPICGSMFGWAEYFFVNAGYPPKLPVHLFNCTKRGTLVDETYYTGKMVDWTFCNPADCCKQYHGLHVYSDAETNVKAVQEGWDIYQNGMCTEQYHMEMYCALFSGAHKINCVEQFISPGEREAIIPCYDHTLIWFVNHCKIYGSSGYFSNNWEPPLYYVNGAPWENSAADAVAWYPDKVCHPYVYYYPEYGTGGESLDASGSGSDFFGSVFLALLFVGFS